MNIKIDAILMSARDELERYAVSVDEKKTYNILRVLSALAYDGDYRSMQELDMIFKTYGKIADGRVKYPHGKPPSRFNLREILNRFAH